MCLFLSTLLIPAQTQKYHLKYTFQLESLKKDLFWDKILDLTTIQLEAQG